MTLGKPKPLCSQLTGRVIVGFESHYEGHLRERVPSSVHCAGSRGLSSSHPLGSMLSLPWLALYLKPNYGDRKDMWPYRQLWSIEGSLSLLCGTYCLPFGVLLCHLHCPIQATFPHTSCMWQKWLPVHLPILPQC